jgi:hypothetical protein
VISDDVKIDIDDLIDSHRNMGTILVVRDDAERVTSTPARAELGSGVRAQNETAAAHGGESAATRLVLGHVVTARTIINIISK